MADFSAGGRGGVVALSCCEFIEVTKALRRRVVPSLHTPSWTLYHPTLSLSLSLSIARSLARARARSLSLSLAARGYAIVRES